MSQHRSNNFLKKLKSFAKNNLLLIGIFISILVGFAIGFGLRSSSWYKTENVLWFTLPGNLFIRALELFIVPVVFVGVVTATSSLSAKNNLKLTVISMGLILLTHVLAASAAVVGSLILVELSVKNQNETLSNPTIVEKQKTTYDIISDILRNLIPKNIIRATTQQEITRYIVDTTSKNLTFKRKVEYIDGSNVLGILVFAILLGLASSALDKKAELFRNFFKSANDVIILILSKIIHLAPIGIASLIVEAVLDVDDIEDSFRKIGLFTGLCTGVLVFYGVFVLSVLMFILTRKNPFKYYIIFFEPVLLAFASTSGAVCIPKSLEVCEKKLKMDSRISNFTIPFYTTLQADGSAIFIVMSCVFLATFEGITLSVGDYIVIIIMTSILCLCLPSVPSSSIVTILVVLNSINLSLNIALLYTVEWFLDRARTAVNQYSHCAMAYATYKLTENSIQDVDDSKVSPLTDSDNLLCETSEQSEPSETKL